MTILAVKNTKVICQSLTGSPGTFHAEKATAYDSQRRILAGDSYIGAQKIVKAVRG